MNDSKVFFSQGVTLIELVISIMIISIAITGILSLFLGTSRTSADPMIRAQSLAIAQSYMDEIFMQPYSNDGATAGRVNFNEISDYDTSGAFFAVQDQFGNSISQLAGYSVKVEVTTPTDFGDISNNLNIRRIKVTVKHAGLKTEIPLIAHRADY